MERLPLLHSRWRRLALAGIAGAYGPFSMVLERWFFLWKKLELCGDDSGPSELELRQYRTWEVELPRAKRKGCSPTWIQVAVALFCDPVESTEKTASKRWGEGQPKLARYPIAAPQSEHTCIEHSWPEEQEKAC